jgi:glycine/D-amino acid oxidase-like deaminating enzyme
MRFAPPLALQRNAGISAHEIASDVAQRIHPLLDLGGPFRHRLGARAGYADAYLTLSAYARAARRLGATLREGVAVTGLRRDGAASPASRRHEAP